MSTSDALPPGLTANLPANLLDIDTLTQLANAFFKSPAGVLPGETSSGFPAGGSSYGGHGVGSIREPQSSLPDPHGLAPQERVPLVPHVAHGLPHSEAGDGTSAAAYRPAAEQISGSAHGFDLPFARELHEVLQVLRQPARATPAVPA